MGDAVSSSHVVCATPSSSGGGLLTLFPCSSARCLSRERVLHKLLTNYPSVGPFYGVQSFSSRLLHGGSPMGSQVLPTNLLQHGLLSLHRATGPGRSLLQHGLPTVSLPSSGIHLVWRGVFHGLQVDICSIVDLHGLQRDNLPYRGLLHRLQGKLCSGHWSTSSPCFFP